MSQPYSVLHTLKGYDKPINCIAFSPTGEFLATGGEDECLRIWSPHDAKILACISTKSPILCLEWDPIRRKRLFFGCQNGTVAFIDSFGKTPAQPIQTGIEGGQVYALSIDGHSGHVGISIGPEVHVARELVADGSYATFSILPEPTPLPETAQNSDTRIRGRSIKFVKKGTRVIVSYLNHGVVCWDVQSSLPLWRISPAHENRHIGSSMLSPDGRSLLVSNLSNGMNLYSLETRRVSSSYQYTVNPRTNYPLSVAFLKRGKLVTCGTHTGTVEIWDKNTGEIFQTLDHNTPLITCLSAQISNGYEYIATATTANNPEIKIWRADAESTLSELMTEHWQRSTMWLNDNYNEKKSRDIILALCVAFGTYLFTIYIQEPVVPVVPTEHADTRLTTWTNSAGQFYAYWTTSTLSTLYHTWAAICRMTCQGLVNWLEVQPHEVYSALEVDVTATTGDLPSTIYL